MNTQGPFDLTLNQTLTLNDPGATSNNPATAVQIQNASPFIVEVNSGGDVLTIQSFTAQTMATSGGGQFMTVTPIQTGVSAQQTALVSLTVVWLLAGESSPMVDGPLTAAALNAILSSAGLAGSKVVVGGTGVASGTSLHLSTAPNFQIWTWGVQPAVLSASSWPTLGGLTMVVDGINTVTDSIGFQEGGSDRLSGLRAQGGVTFYNYTDKTVVAFINYSVD